MSYVQRSREVMRIYRPNSRHVRDSEGKLHLMMPPCVRTYASTYWDIKRLRLARKAVQLSELSYPLKGVALLGRAAAEWGLHSVLLLRLYLAATARTTQSFCNSTYVRMCVRCTRIFDRLIEVWQASYLFWIPREVTLSFAAERRREGDQNYILSLPHSYLPAAIQRGKETMRMCVRSCAELAVSSTKVSW